MKFRFQYEPVALKKYVKETFRQVNMLPYPDYDASSFKSLLDRLRGQADIKVNEPLPQFKEWVEQLTVRQKELLPFIFPQLLTMGQKGIVITEIQRLVRDKKIVFAHLLHQLYMCEDDSLKPFWELLRIAYQTKPELYNRFWPKPVQDAWVPYVRVKEKQAEFVGQQVLARIKNIEGALDLYFIRPEHVFYKQVMEYVFSHGTLELYKQEEQRFVEMFEAADNVFAQQLASGFIEANALEELEEVGYTIYNRLYTYIKKPMLWSETEESVKARFHQWYLRKNIWEFFDGVSKNHERFIYWEKFIYKMRDALVLDDRKTILFYFSDVVIMEILGTGAVYIYLVDTFKEHFGEKVEKYREGLESEYYKKHGSSPYRLKRDDVRSTHLLYNGKRLLHSGDWQQQFDYYLKTQLDWEV